MDHRIARMHQSYRLHGIEGPAPAVASRLDRVAATRLPEAIDRALAAALGDDPAVVVVRRVRARFAIRLDASRTDEALASSWAARIAGAILRTLDDGNGRGEVARFDDRAAYAASFAADLLAGRAWDRWYYATFAPLRALPVPHALASLLADHRDVLPLLLARLRRDGRLEAVLAALPPAAARDLRDGPRALAPTRPDAPEANRPLFAIAARLLDRLGLRPIPPESLAPLWAAYRDADPRPPEVDWLDRDAMTAGVVHSLRALLAGRPPSQPDDPPTPDEVRHALLGLDADWLDAEAVSRALARLLDPRGPAMPRRGPTPSQSKLLGEIRRAIADASGSLVADPIDAPANALRIIAALVDRCAARADDPAAPPMIAALLSAAAALARGPRREPSLRDPDGSPADPAALRAVAPLGPEAAELVAALAERAGSATARAAAADDWIATGCAGLFFLIRPIMDLRISSLRLAAADPSGDGDDFPGFPELLASLALRWAGPDCDPDDPGLALIAGLADEGRLHDRLATAWASTAPAALGRFQAALLRQLVGLRMLDPSTIGVFAEALPDCRRLLAGDASTGLWALGRVVDGDAAPVVSEWMDLIENGSGVRPSWGDIGEGACVVGRDDFVRLLDRFA